MTLKHVSKVEDPLIICAVYKLFSPSSFYEAFFQAFLWDFYIQDLCLEIYRSECTLITSFEPMMSHCNDHERLR